MLALLAVVGLAVPTQAAWEDRPQGQRVGYTILAGVENVVPIASAFAAPRCLPGYIPCKFTFAFFSLLAAGEQLAFSGGADLEQTRAILYRGFGGDWYLTGAHAAGDETPDVLPDPGRGPAPGSGSAPAPDAGSGSAPAPDAGSGSPPAPDAGSGSAF
jgi:hypothetical protein